MAAGVTLARDGLDAFRDFMNLTLEREVEAGRGDDVLRIDAAITSRGASTEFARGVGLAGPFGQGNSEPIFAFPTLMVSYASVVGAHHVRARLRAGDGAEMDAICFRALESPLGEALLRGRGAELSCRGAAFVGLVSGQ